MSKITVTPFSWCKKLFLCRNLRIFWNGLISFIFFFSFLSSWFIFKGWEFVETTKSHSRLKSVSIRWGLHDPGWPGQNLISTCNRRVKYVPAGGVEIWSSLIYDTSAEYERQSATQATRMRHEWDTSAPRVLHEPHKCDTSQKFWFW